MDQQTDELRRAHDALADLYVERLADALDRLPVDRAVLGLFCELVNSAHPGGIVGDIGCGTGRLARYFASFGLLPRGIDLSPGMVAAARRQNPEHEFTVADVRALPFGDGELAGIVCWYSLMYLRPEERPKAYAELARVLRPGGHLVTAFKVGNNELRRGGRSTGLDVEFDLYFMSADEVAARVVAAGLQPIFSARRIAGEGESSAQGYLIARAN